MRTHVDLFSGIGGFSLACEWAGVETIAFSEIDPYANRVLQRHWPHIKNYGDVREFPRLSAWLLTAGVPCQPASVAGNRKGAADDRWLWPQALAVVENGSYEWLLFENPTGILSLNDGLEFERICSALESQGYEVQPLIIPACAVGAPHRRDRCWVLAHSKIHSKRRLSFGEGAEYPRPTIGSQDVPYAASLGQSRSRQSIKRSGQATDTNRKAVESFTVSKRAEWPIEPDVGRVANGIPARMDRLRGLGNTIVPPVAYQLIKRMIEAEAHATTSTEPEGSK